MLRTITGFLLVIAAIGCAQGVSDQASVKPRLEQAGIATQGLMSLPDGTVILDLEGTNLTDLQPLHGLPISSLNLTGTAVTNLAPLKGMPLRVLGLARTGVTDLAPLRGMKLEFLDLRASAVKDLASLGGTRVESLDIAATPVTDLTPLKTIPLKSLIFSPRRIKTGIGTVRVMKSLQLLGTDAMPKLMPRADFWRRFDKGEIR